MQQRFHPFCEKRQFTFGHAINSKSKLKWFLERKLDIAEGDILWGTHLPSNKKICIMAHPPDLHSELSFKTWVETATSFGFGLKVDLKESGIINVILDILTKTSFPQDKLIINADIQWGEHGHKPNFNFKDVQKIRDRFPEVLISLGCTVTEKTSRYRSEDLLGLLDYGGQLGGFITYALRSDLALRGIRVLNATGMLKEHISIWNKKDFNPSTPEEVSNVLRTFPHVLVDLMDRSGEPTREKATTYNQHVDGLI